MVMNGSTSNVPNGKKFNWNILSDGKTFTADMVYSLEDTTKFVNLTFVNNKTDTIEITSMLSTDTKDKADFILLIKVLQPLGSGKYERKPLEEIDPEQLAPKLITKAAYPTERTKDVINRAIEQSKTTLSTIDDDLPEEHSSPDDGYKTVSGKKRDRSSPGASNSTKKIRFQSEIEAKIIKNMFNSMGLERFLEE